MAMATSTSAAATSSAAESGRPSAAKASCDKPSRHAQNNVKARAAVKIARNILFTFHIVKTRWLREVPTQISPRAKLPPGVCIIQLDTGQAPGSLYIPHVRLQLTAPLTFKRQCRVQLVQRRDTLQHDFLG